MAKSLGPVVAVLAARTENFTSSMKRAVIQAENDAAKIRKAFRTGGSVAAGELLQTQVDQTLAQSQRRAQQWARSRGIGPQGLQGQRSDPGKALGGLMETAAKAAIAVKGVTAAMDFASIAHKAFRGDAKAAAQEIEKWAKATPILGGITKSIEGLVEEFSGLAAAKEELARAEKNRKETIALVTSLREKGLEASRGAHLAGLEGNALSRAEINFRADEAIRSLETEFQAYLAKNRDTVDARQESVLGQNLQIARRAIEQQRAAELAAVDRDAARAREQEHRASRDSLNSVRQEIAYLRTKRSLGDDAARVYQIQAEFQAKIAKAREKGDIALARELGILRYEKLQGLTAGGKLSQVESKALTAVGASVRPIRVEGTERTNSLLKELVNLIRDGRFPAVVR